MAASMASKSMVKSGRSGTPINSSPKNSAFTRYITNEGAGASTLAPGLDTNMVSRSINSSEPLPNTNDASAGMA